VPRPKKEQPNHKGGLYEVKITVDRSMDGKLVRKSFYSSISKEDARRQAEAWKMEKAVSERTGVAFVEKDVTFAQWALKWLESIRGTVKDNTYQLTYVNSVKKHLMPCFGDMVLSEIRPIDIKNFFNEKNKTLSRETQKKLLRCLNTIFEEAVDNNLCAKNPCKKIKLAKDTQNQEKRVYNAEQVDLILRFA